MSICPLLALTLNPSPTHGRGTSNRSLLFFSSWERGENDFDHFVGLFQVVGRGSTQAFDEAFKVQFALFPVIAKLLPSRYNVDTLYTRFFKRANYSDPTNLKVRFNRWLRQLQNGEIV
jgi:hypothetical protein